MDKKEDKNQTKQEKLGFGRRSKDIFIILLVLVLFAVVATYYRAMIAKDFEVFFDDYEEEVLLEE